MCINYLLNVQLKKDMFQILVKFFLSFLPLTCFQESEQSLRHTLTPKGSFDRVYINNVE